MVDLSVDEDIPRCLDGFDAVAANLDQAVIPKVYQDQAGQNSAPPLHAEVRILVVVQVMEDQSWDCVAESTVVADVAADKELADAVDVVAVAAGSARDVETEVKTVVVEAAADSEDFVDLIQDTAVAKVASVPSSSI